MGILDIDHENVIVNTVRVKDRTAFIIDNFYLYPNAVASLFNDETPLDQMVNNNFYPGTRMHLSSKVSPHETDKHLKQLYRILYDNGFDASKLSKENEFFFSRNERVVRSPEIFLSVFNQKEAEQKWIGIDEVNGTQVNKDTDACVPSHVVTPLANAHVDSKPTMALNTLACTCYLSKHDHGGTGLYYNKLLQTHCASWEFYKNDLIKLLGKIDEASSDEEKIKTIISHRNVMLKCELPSRATGMINTENENWELLHLFPMKFNRMVVYTADVYHALYLEDLDFWRKHKRITSNYFIPMYWQDENGAHINPLDRLFEVLQYFYNTTTTITCIPQSLEKTLRSFRKKYMTA